MADYRPSLLNYDEYKNEITKIKGYDIKGTGNEETIIDIIADIPVSDGTDITLGYAYIDNTTGNVKVKMS